MKLSDYWLYMRNFPESCQLLITHTDTVIMLMCCPSCCVRTLETPLSPSFCLSICLSQSPLEQIAVLLLSSTRFWLLITPFSFQLNWRSETHHRRKASRKKQNEGEQEPSSPPFPDVLCLFFLSVSLSVSLHTLMRERTSVSMVWVSQLFPGACL